MSTSSSIAQVNEPLTRTHNLEQQGHRETTAGLGENPGNFKKILELEIRHDITILDRLNAGSLSNRYTSKDIHRLLIPASVYQWQILTSYQIRASWLTSFSTLKLPWSSYPALGPSHR